jgi:hypothetical protein
MPVKDSPQGVPYKPGTSYAQKRSIERHRPMQQRQLRLGAPLTPNNN